MAEFTIPKLQLEKDSVSNISDVSLSHDNSIMKTHVVHISQGTEQMCNGQDYTCSGTALTELFDEFHWACVFDGHGSNKCIDFIRSIQKDDLDAIMRSPNPVMAMVDKVHHMAHIQNYESSGSTMCAARVFSDRIEIINCGDSQAAVYKNGETIFLSEEHNGYNQAECDRIKELDPNIYFTDSRNIKVVSDTHIHTVPSKYVNFTNGSRLALTQALGHCERTGYQPSLTTIPIEPGQTYKVVIGSDGLWDMIMRDNEEDMNRLTTMSGEDIVKFVVERWLQHWEMCLSETPDVVAFSGKYRRQDCDDVCAISIDIQPL